MKTFTLDSRYGEISSEIRWIEDQTREKLNIVVNDFIKNCIENDVETTSASGLFFEMVFQELTMARTKQVSELRKRERENNQ